MQPNVHQYLQSEEWFNRIYNELEKLNSPEETLKLKHELDHNTELGLAIRIIRQNRQVISQETTRFLLQGENTEQLFLQLTQVAVPSDEPEADQSWLNFLHKIDSRLYLRIAAAVILFIGIVLFIKLQYTNFTESQKWVTLAETNHSQVQQYLKEHVSMPAEILFGVKGDERPTSPLEEVQLALSRASFRMKDVGPMLARVPRDSANLVDLYWGMAYLFAADQSIDQAIPYLKAARNSPSAGIAWVATYYLGNAYLGKKDYVQGVAYLREVTIALDAQKGLRVKATRELQFLEKLKKEK